MDRRSALAPSRPQVGRWLLLGSVALAWLLVLGVAVGRSMVHDGGTTDGGGSGAFEPVGEETPTTTAWSYTDPVSYGSPTPVETSAGPGVAIPGHWTHGPRFIGGLVVAMTHDLVLALDPMTGEVVWASNACWGASFHAPIQGPADAAAVLVGCGDELLAFDPATGALLWREDMGGAIDRVRVGPEVVVRQTTDDIVAIDLRTGARRGSWTGLGDAIAVSNRDTVFVSNRDGVHAFALDTGEARWSVDQQALGLGATEDAVYAPTTLRLLTRLDADTGAIDWESEAEPARLDWSDIAGFSDTTAVVQATDQYARGSTRVRFLTVYDPSSGRKVWSDDAGPDVFMSYAVGSRFVLCVVQEDNPGGGHIFIREAADGSLVAELDGVRYNSEVATDGDLVAAYIGTFPDTTLQIVQVR